MTDLSNVTLECGCHTTLVHYGGVLSPYWHHSPFVHAERSCHGCQINVVRMNSGLKERICHINFAPDLALYAVHKDIVYTR